MKKFWRIVLTLLILLVVYILGNAASICIYSIRDETVPADAAIVLGAGTYNGSVSLVYQERLNHAARLYERGIVKKIIPTGGTGQGSNQSDGEAAMNYLIGLGIPADDIIPEETSAITQENLENAKIIMEENGFETALVVSDPLHMKRAMLLARDAGITAFSSPTTTSRYVTLKTKIPFLARELFFYVGYKWYRIFF